MAFLQIVHGFEIIRRQVHGRYLNRVMKQVVNDEAKHDEPAHGHRPRSITGRNYFVGGIRDGTRSPVFDSELNGGPNVQKDHDKKTDSRKPEKFNVTLKKMAVGVSLFRA